MLYLSILETGSARGDFLLRGSAEAIARGLVALEDGLGLQVVIGHPGVGREQAERILLDYAGMAVGLDLAEVPVLEPEPAGERRARPHRRPPTASPRRP